MKKLYDCRLVKSYQREKSDIYVTIKMHLKIEPRKFILATFLHGNHVVLFDNIAHKLVVTLETTEYDEQR